MGGWRPGGVLAARYTLSDRVPNPRSVGARSFTVSVDAVSFAKSQPAADSNDRPRVCDVFFKGFVSGFYE